MANEVNNRPAWMTVPNLLTLFRAIGIPIFLMLILQEEYAWAVLTLVLAGATDYLDGKAARYLKQESRLGELLDPSVDRLYIITVLAAMFITGAIPVWILLLIFLRDLSLGFLLVLMKRKGIPPFRVTYLGKAATFNLLYALPLLLLTFSSSSMTAELAFIFGWAFAGWGISLYLLTGLQYALEGIRKIRVVSRTSGEDQGR